jgi:deoxyhypusine synthase
MKTSPDTSRHHFRGKNIPHVQLTDDMDISELVDVFANSGYNARKLGEAARLYEKMIEEDAFICLTVSGALTPVGFGGIFKSLIENGFVDWFVTTGANVYHEEHFAWGLPIKQGHFDVDDNILFQKNIVRIRDVYIKGEGTLMAQDKIVQRICEDNFDKSFTTAEFCNLLGKYTKQNSRFPHKSFIVAAYDYDVPVYISTLKDSSLGLDLAPLCLKGTSFKLDLIREIIEHAAIVYNSKKSGIIELGGGVPKSIAEQTDVFLGSILNLNALTKRYMIQITDARPDTGSFSGSVPKTIPWLQRGCHDDTIVVYSDATIAFPILAMYLLSKKNPRKPKRLYKKLADFSDVLAKNANLNFMSI